jgi:hypothetical protein
MTESSTALVRELVNEGFPKELATIVSDYALLPLPIQEVIDEFREIRELVLEWVVGLADVSPRAIFRLILPRSGSAAYRQRLRWLRMY